MYVLTILALQLSFTSTVVAQSPPSVVINEFMASNTSFNRDPQGQYDDWIELYNYGNNAINIGGMYLTDDLTAPTKWQIPAGVTVPPDGYLLIWRRV